MECGIPRCNTFLYFLGMFAILRKVNISCIMAVPPSICMGQLVSHWMDFYEILYLSIFQKYFEKFQISLKSTKMNGNIV